MTEIYHGPWSPVWGDQPPVSKVEDPYHPQYPDAEGVSCPSGYPAVTEASVQAQAGT